MSNSDYSVRQLMEIEACTNCQICADVCPAVAGAQDGELSGVHRIQGIKDIARARGGVLRWLFGRREPSQEARTHFGDTVFRCTLCGNCEEVCPVGIRLKDLWISLRQDMVHSGTSPKKMGVILDNMVDSHNVFDEDNEERAEWVEDMRDPPDHGYTKDRADVVYFTGCTAAYFPVAQRIPVALAQIMEGSGVDFTLLGEEEWCCGFPLLGAGQMDAFQQFMDHNLEAIRQKGANRVVFACPSCYQMWREHYPPEFEIVHATQLLKELVNENRIPFQELPLRVTYHDPCDLGRGAGVYDDPRDVIQAIPGIDFVELSRNRENCRCCGGGGNLEMVDPTLAGDIAGQKIDEVISTGAQAVVTSCQQCVRTMTTYVRRNKISLEVMDVTQLVHRALAP
jgi:heterodisulfide reductase subunit D